MSYLTREQRKQLFASVRYHYFNVVDGGHVCVATAQGLDSAVWFGLSFCSPKDRFSKKKGRMVAFRRLVKNVYNDNWKSCYFRHQETLSELAVEYLESLQDEELYPSLPKWLVKKIENYVHLSGLFQPRKLPKEKPPVLNIQLEESVPAYSAKHDQQ